MMYGLTFPYFSDPRIVSALVVLVLIALAGATSSGVSSFVLRRRISSQNAELKAKVQALELLEARQDAVIRALPDLILTFDPEARFTGYMTSDESMFALDPQRCIGKSVKDIFGDGVFHEKTRSAIARALAGEGTQVFEYALEAFAPDKRYEARIVRLSADRALSICRDVTDRYRAEGQREAILLEKEALLREIHHRVKNNMQIVSSLLSMQSLRAKDEYDKGLFADSQGRIRAMAAVHDQLYRSDDFTSIGAGEYLSDLVSELAASWSRPGRDISVSVDAGAVSLELESAVPIGLIVNELVTNSYKYAFGLEQSGSIRVEVERAEGGGLSLLVSDDGSGFPDGFDPERCDDGMGYVIINALVRQMRGSIETSSPEGGGSAVRISAPFARQP